MGVKGKENRSKEGIEWKKKEERVSTGYVSVKEGLTRISVGGRENQRKSVEIEQEWMAPRH